MPQFTNLFSSLKAPTGSRGSFIDRLTKRRKTGQQSAATSAPSSVIDVKNLQSTLTPTASRFIAQSKADKTVAQNADRLPTKQTSSPDLGKILTSLTPNVPRVNLPPFQQPAQQQAAVAPQQAAPQAPTTPTGLTLGQAQAIQAQQPQQPIIRQPQAPPAMQAATKALQQPAPQQPAPTPPTFEPRPTDPQVQALRERVTGGFTPSAEETQIQQQLNQILGGAERGAEDIRTQPIATPFLRGQAAALGRQAEIQAAPLQRQLALLQSQRVAEQEAAQTQLDFEAGDVETRREEQKAFEKGTREEAIFGLLRQGITDPAEISGLMPGVPAEEIFDLLKADKELAKDEATLETSIVQSGGKSLLVNTQTGETIRDLGLTEGSLARAATARLAEQKANAARETGEDVNPFLAQLGSVATGVVTDLSGRIGISTVGPGALVFAKIPGTPSFDFAADLETLKADVGFGILQQMREASKTGGALGQVSERELSFLQNTLASINQFQSIGNFKKNLGKVQESIDRWTNAVAKDTPTGTGSFTTSGGNEVTITEI